MGKFVLLCPANASCGAKFFLYPWTQYLMLQKPLAASFGFPILFPWRLCFCFPPFFFFYIFRQTESTLPAPLPQRCRSEVEEEERKNKLFHSILSPRRLLPFSSQRERRRTLFLQKKERKSNSIAPTSSFSGSYRPFPSSFFITSCARSAPTQ